MSWIVVRNWERFQHYKDRDPVWIKNYTALLHDDDYLNLTPTACALLHRIWLLYAATNAVLSQRHVHSHRSLGARASHWKELTDAGFIHFSASKPLALARAREEKEKETPKPPLEKKQRRVTGWREVRGSHGSTLIPDPFGTDKAPAR